MLTLIRVLYAETLKLKRTLALLLVLVAPVAVAFLQFMAYLTRRPMITEIQGDLWIRLTINDLVLWSLLMLPLFISLETALLSGLEHGNKTWKQIYAMPVPRWTIYAAKQLVTMGLIGASTLVLYVLIIATGLALRLIGAEYQFNFPVPVATMFAATAATFLASWLILSLHLWISAHWSSYVLAFAVGIVATVGTIMIVQSDYAVWYPWTLPGYAAVNFMEGKEITAELLFGAIGGILFSLFGAWEVTRREVA